MVWKVGNGLEVFFWEDQWRVGGSLASRYERLYKLSCWKQVSVKFFIENWRISDARGRWSRNLREWELIQARELDDIIQEVILSGINDQLICRHNKDGYSSKAGYAHYFNVSEINNVAWSKLWRIKIPPKVILFLWKIEHGVLPTSKFLYSRLNNGINPICLRCIHLNLEEDIPHIFWRCSFALEVWLEVADWWGISRSKLNSVKGNTWKMMGIFASSLTSKVWEIAVVSTLWSLWLSRN